MLNVVVWGETHMQNLDPRYFLLNWYLQFAANREGLSTSIANPDTIASLDKLSTQLLIHFTAVKVFLFRL